MIYYHSKECPQWRRKEDYKLQFLENVFGRGKYTLSEREYLWNERLGGEINIQKILRNNTPFRKLIMTLYDVKCICSEHAQLMRSAPSLFHVNELPKFKRSFLFSNFSVSLVVFFSCFVRTERYYVHNFWTLKLRKRHLTRKSGISRELIFFRFSLPIHFRNNQARFLNT